MPSKVESLKALCQSYSSFADHQALLVSGPELGPVLAATQHALKEGQAQAATLFHDPSGRRTEVGPLESEADVAQRLQAPGQEPSLAAGPGRPKLGVVSREVSLLPRHWEWLATQSGGASAALRRLIEEARKGSQAQDGCRLHLEAVDKALTVLAGDQVAFEEVLRAMYAKDFSQAIHLCESWPKGLGAHFQRQLSLAQQWHALALAEAEAIHFSA